MAVTSVKRSWEQGSASRDGYEYVEKWKVIADAALNAHTVLTADDGAGGVIPSIGTAYGPNTDAQCYFVEGPQVRGAEAGQLLWEVTVRYRTPTRSSQAGDPLDDPVQISWEFQPVLMGLEYDIYSKVIQNSAKDPFVPAPEKIEYMPVLTIVRNEATFNAQAAYRKLGKVNSDKFTVAGVNAQVRHARLVQYTGVKAERNGTEYYQVTYRIEWAHGRRKVNGTWEDCDWDACFLDQGLYSVTAGIKGRILVSDLPGGDPDKHIPVTVPVKLDGSGDVLGAAADPCYEKFRIYEEIPFRPLNLPVSE